MCIRDRHSTAELGLLRGELNKQVTKISEVQESMTLKIAEVEKSVSSVEESMSTKISVIEETMSNKISAVEISMANIREQFMKVQQKQTFEQTVPCLLYTSRCV